MSRPLTNTTTYRERIVTARKDRRCDNYPPCRNGIKAGDRYLICTEYPGGESGYADTAGHPVRLHLCAAHSLGRVEPVGVSGGVPEGQEKPE